MIKITLKTLFYLLIILTGSLTACHIETRSDFSGDLNTIQEKTFSIQPGKDLKVDASVGDVTITTWDKPEVYIKILGNKRAKDKIDLTFNNDENEVSVIAKSENSFFNWFSHGIQLRFEIKVPSEFNTNINTAGGDIQIGEIRGNNKLRTSGGDVRVKNSDGVLKISTSGGEINLDTNSGTMDVATSGGDIKARDFKGDLTASTSGGDINMKLPSDFNASASMYTSGGEINCELTANNAKKISSSRFEADLNSGGAELIAKTSGGDITIKK